MGGSFQPSRYFSGGTASPFFGVSHALNNKLLLKAEYDSSVRPGLVPFRIPENDFSFGVDYLITVFVLYLLAVAFEGRVTVMSVGRGI